MNIFAGPNQDVGVVPLVDLWLDLADNLKQEDIPNPLELLKERDAVVRYISDNLARVERSRHLSLARQHHTSRAGTRLCVLERSALRNYGEA